jgi:hypothetical protein
VEFRYSPLSFRIGLAISLATVAALLGFGVAGIVLQRRRRMH